MSLEKVVFGFFVNVVAVILKFGDRTQIGALHLATSLVAVIQLLAAAITWIALSSASDTTLSPSQMSSVVSLSGGALLANVISIILLVTETVTYQRR